MKHTVLILVLSFICFSCKNESKGKVETPAEAKESEEKINETKRDTYLLMGLKGDKEVYQVQKELENGIFIEEVALVNDLENRFICVLKMNASLTQEDIEKYRFALRFFPYDEDKEFITNKYARETGKPYEPSDFEPKLKLFEGEAYLIKGVYNELRDFKKMEIFLFDSDGFKGKKGNTIEIQEISF